MTSSLPMAGPMISVQTVVQLAENADDDAGDKGRAAPGEPPALLRQQHRVAAGTSIRELLRLAGLEHVAAAITAGRLGLAVYGKRAWLDDILADGSRVEVVAPIAADAKAARAARVAADRSRRRLRFGGRK